MKHFEAPSSRLRRFVPAVLLILTAGLVPTYVLAARPLQASAPQNANAGPRAPWITRSETDKRTVYSGDLAHAEIRQGLTLLFQRARVKYKIDPGVEGKISFSFRNVDFNSVLHCLLIQADSTFRVERGTFHVAARKSVESSADLAPVASWWPVPYVDAQPSTPGSSPDATSKLFDWQVEKIDAREALRAIFRRYLVSYSIAPDVQGTVSLELKDASIDAVLDALCKQVNATYTLKDGVYVITRKPKDA